MTEWISVKDRLPKQGNYLAYATGNNEQTRHWAWDVRFLSYLPQTGWVDNSLNPMVVTHWQELPEPPK